MAPSSPHAATARRAAGRLGPALLLAALCLPCAPARAGGGAAADAPLRLERTPVDYGRVVQGRTLTRTVRYTNAGGTRIEKLRAKPDCGCLGATLSATSLAPGEEGTLTLRFRTHGMIGRVRKHVALLYEADGPHLLKLPVVLDVAGGVLVERLHFGEVLAGTRPEGRAVVKWAEGKGRPFEIVDVTVPGADLATEVAPLPEKPGSIYRGWVITFRFEKPPPRGVFSEKAVVQTTHPEQKLVYVPLTAHVVGKVWLQTSRVHLGLVREGTTKSAAITVRAFDWSISLGKVRAEARGDVLEVALEDAPDSRGRPAKRLRVTVPATAPPGPLDDVIELHTEVPGEEVVEVEVRGRVFTPRGR